MTNNCNRKNILHITPHLGGGVGQVVLNWLCYDKSNTHSIITLDFANEKAKAVCKKEKIKLFSQIPTDKILNLIKETDILVIHFWNHPLLFDFLIRHNLPDCRCIIYSHISGLTPPNVIGKKILFYADRFIYTTPISKEIDNTADVIISTGGIEHVKDLTPKKHTGFCVGYIGTVDYAKMHPDYINVMKKINNVNFLIVGGDREKEISKEADGRFNFTGKVEDIRPYLSQMDVFGYLLNPLHFGTAEQVLQEAMAAGVVPVVLNNKCESLIVKHNTTGLVAKNSDEYVKYIELLRDDTKLRQKLSKQAKDYALEFFSISNYTKEWLKVINEVAKLEKTPKIWPLDKQKDISAFDIFLESIDVFANEFMLKSDEELKILLQNPNWQSCSKGTPKQYYAFFSTDEKLKRIVELYE